jgi:phosphosulfolactate synthase (CoM biosynthesis protein A)
MADSSVKLTLGFAPLASAVQSAVVQGMQHAGEDGKQIAQSLARVDTGEMRESIDFTVEDSGAVVSLTLSVGTDHGLVNETGSSKMSAQPMIRPAADQIGPRLGEYIGSALGGGI